MNFNGYYYLFTRRSERDEHVRFQKEATQRANGNDLFIIRTPLERGG